MTSYEPVQTHQRLVCPPLTDVPPFGQGKHESMMTNRTAESTSDPADLPVVARVDTHADTHHVAVLSTTGARLGDQQVPTTPAGHEPLLTFVRAFGQIQLIGIEGTSSYGAGLSRYLLAHDVEIREIIRPRRAARRHGKSDPFDAYAAAGQALAEPDSLPLAKTGDGVVEQIRVLLTVRRSAIKARVALTRQIKSLLITAPEAVRTRWTGMAQACLIDSLAATRPGPDTDSTTSATGQGLRRLARRCQYLTTEITEADDELRALLDFAAPSMIATKGYSVITTATLLITAGSNPERLRSEASFAALCGTSPIPASSGKTNRYRRGAWWRPASELGAASDWAGALVQRPTDESLRSTTTSEWKNEEGRSTVPQTRHRPRGVPSSQRPSLMTSGSCDTNVVRLSSRPR